MSEIQHTLENASIGIMIFEVNLAIKNPKEIWHFYKWLDPSLDSPAL